MTLSYDIQALADLVRLVACEELLPRHGRLLANQINQHADGSLFTEADLRSEARLTAGARIIWPGVLTTGEEEISQDPSWLSKMAQHRDIIIFDPIDGTGAFKRGEDTYGIMAAVIKNGVTQAGIIYTPGHAILQNDGSLKPERDLMIIAERGNGCYINGSRTTMGSRATTMDHARIAFACRNQDKAFESVLADGVAGYMPRNNASHDYTRILTGTSDVTFYSEGFTPAGLGRCPPWDHAAGVLAIEEAGGVAALPYGGQGRPYAPLYCHDRLLVSANRDLFDAVLNHVRTRAPGLCAPRPIPAQTPKPAP